jgi:hypothetical protein
MYDCKDRMLFSLDFVFCVCGIFRKNYGEEKQIKNCVELVSRKTINIILPNLSQQAQLFMP